MSSARSIGNTQYMKKRVPRNPKYHHVKPKVDTGCSLVRYMERMEELKKNYRYRKGELFKRLKVSTFAQLVIQVASVSELNDMAVEDLDDNVTILSDVDMEQNNNSPDRMPVFSEDCDSEFGLSPRSTLQSLISGVGELDMDRYGQGHTNVGPISSARVSEQPYPDCPYLLLDVRDKEDYERCHIISAYNYPIATLSRTMDPYTKEVLEYKNSPGKIIILYDEDERIASIAATTMFERGFENVFMLSGGLKVIGQKFPEGMTTGNIPVQCLLSPTATRSLGRGHLGQGSYPAEKKCRFSFEDISKIQEHQEEMLVPSASNVTVTSKSSSLSKSTSRTSQQTLSVAGTDGSRSQRSRPWR
ncbi:centrosomal protein of 41 kDa [Anguilla rostrata]|uniref:centrosomal protein of 41 kDa n=1 Tax=Anguilla rostrata TaxID=7938 RepID=UPI0030D09DA1